MAAASQDRPWKQYSHQPSSRSTCGVQASCRSIRAGMAFCLMLRSATQALQRRSLVASRAPVQPAPPAIRMPRRAATCDNPCRLEMVASRALGQPVVATLEAHSAARLTLPTALQLETGRRPRCLRETALLPSPRKRLRRAIPRQAPGTRLCHRRRLLRSLTCATPSTTSQGSHFPLLRQLRLHQRLSVARQLVSLLVARPALRVRIWIPLSVIHHGCDRSGKKAQTQGGPPLLRKHIKIWTHLSTIHHG